MLFRTLKFTLQNYPNDKVCKIIIMKDILLAIGILIISVISLKWFEAELELLDEIENN